MSRDIRGHGGHWFIPIKNHEDIRKKATGILTAGDIKLWNTTIRIYPKNDVQ